MKKDSKLKQLKIDENSKIGSSRANKKICMSLSKKDEKFLNEMTENNDRNSIILIILILCFCFSVGTYIGWLLYNISINGGG